jgi:phasin family protein
LTLQEAFSRRRPETSGNPYSVGKFAPAKEIIMTNEEMHKFGKDSMEVAMSSFGLWTKNAQAIAAEVVDYSKKSVEGSTAAWGKLMGAKSIEKAMEVQTEYLKSSYQDFVAEATKLGGLYTDLAKEAYKPFESAMAKVTTMK